MPATENRDLASNDLWQDSLLRSRRRRRQLARARKEQNRRKTASLAVSAAVVAAPVWPNVAGSARFEAKADAGEDLKPREGRDRVLLSFGDTSPSVASLQRKLRIVEDGIFGPQTEAAVRAFQKRTKLPVTGDVDIRTWLTLFPNDAVVAAAGTGSSGEPQWAALSTQPPDGAPAATVPASVSVATDGGPVTQASDGGAAPRRSAEAPRAKAASLLIPEPADTPTEPPTSDGVTPPAPPAEEPAKGTPAPVGGLTPGGQAPGGGQGTPPRPVPIKPPQPVAPIAPGGSFNEMIQAMIREANRIDRARYSYRWGGGHNSRFTGPYDCSGAVSAVLHAAGLLKSPMVSGGFTRWGAPGKGLVTIYANASHVYMSIKGRFFGTSRSNPGGGAGWFRGAPRRGFVVVHVPFERMKPRKRALTRAHAVQPKRRAHVRGPRPAAKFVPQGDSVTGGTTTGAPRPPVSTPAPAAPAPPRVSAPAPAAGQAPAPAAGQAPAGSTGQVPAAPAQPAPGTVKTPVGPVSVPQLPSAPAGPQGSSGSGSAPGGSGSAPSGPAPTSGQPGAAPGPQPSAAPPAPGPSGTTARPGSSGQSAGASPPPAATGPTAPSQGGPVSGLGNQVVSGAGDAVEGVTSKLPSKPAAAAPGSESGAVEGSTGSE